jgi:cytochrome c553
VKRWISILFLVLLPLQFGWAAASAYCQHETGAAARHFGHHEHQHRADSGVDESNKSSGQQAGVIHADCASCHGASAAVILEPLRLSAASFLPMAPPPHSGSVVSAPLSEPERPNWSTPA